ncbi:FGGY family carbohydrate kinase [Enterococcus italicus]|uniref:FGGY family carbohydrate kinase n=1 Tax=Enterococcus italicus TaxID=246144 RepID=UPI003F4642B6
MKLFLGIDIGTTSIKIGVIENSNYIYQSESIIKTYGDENIKYQSKEEIINAIQGLILEVPTNLRKKIEIISFSSAMHSLAIGDEDNIYLWSDQQSKDSINLFKKKQISKKFYEISGTPIHTMSTFSKILYFRQFKEYQSKEIVWLGIKEIIMKYFTGTPFIDYATASATGIFDIKEKKWSSLILRYLGLTERNLAKVVDPLTEFEMLEPIVKYFCFNKKIKVIIGASDGTLAAYAGFYQTGKTESLTIGTSAAYRKVTKSIELSSAVNNFCYYLGSDIYVAGCPSNNGGIILNWTANNLAKNKKIFYEELPSIIENLKIGSNGVRFFPYLNGERAPLWSDKITGSFNNLTIVNTREDLINSVLEGMLINLKTLVDAISQTEYVLASGGVFKIKNFLQLTANILGKNILYSEKNEPIFGLYLLIYQPEIINIDDGDIFLIDKEKNMEYRKLVDTYFVNSCITPSKSKIKFPKNSV